MTATKGETKMLRWDRAAHVRSVLPVSCALTALPVSMRAAVHARPSHHRSRPSLSGYQPGGATGRSYGIWVTRPSSRTPRPDDAWITRFGYKSTFGDRRVEQQKLLLVGRLKDRRPLFEVSSCHRRGRPLA